MPFSNLPNTGIKPASPALQADSLLFELRGGLPLGVAVLNDVLRLFLGLAGKNDVMD